MMVTVNIEGPYEKIIQRAIKEGYAGTKTEVVRQALKAYERQLRIDKAEEERAVGIMVKKLVDDVESGRKKGITRKEMRKKFADKIDK